MSEKDYSYMTGNTYRTPWEPSGLVKVLEAEPGLYFGRTSVFIEFVEDHPMGYKKGEVGRYLADEMREVR